MDERGPPPPGGHSTIAFGDYAPAEQRVSANRYARGHNQNCGNVLTNVPTTRVVAPPGGHSSICFDDGSGAGRPRAGSFRELVNGPLGDDPISRGEIPQGGKQHYKFGTPSPMPTSVRDQLTFQNTHEFGAMGPAISFDPNAPRRSVGGHQNVILGETKASPQSPRHGDPIWPLGKSPAAAGTVRHTRTRPGETTLALSPPQQKDNERLPPGGLQHNIFNRQSLANNPRMFPLEREPSPSGRVPPGGSSNVIFGDDPHSMPVVNRPPSGNTGTPRGLREKHQEMQDQRQPPGGHSTIQFG